MATVIAMPPRPRPDNSMAFGSSYCVTVQWMTLRNPFTLINDEMRVPLSMSSGILPRQPPNIVIQSPNRLRSDASFQAESGDSFDDVETSTRATSSHSLPWLENAAALALHTLGCPLDKPRVRGSDPFPGLIQLLGHINDLRRLGFGCVDFFSHV